MAKPQNIEKKALLAIYSQVKEQYNSFKEFIKDSVKKRDGKVVSLTIENENFNDAEPIGKLSHLETLAIGIHSLEDVCPIYDAKRKGVLKNVYVEGIYGLDKNKRWEYK